jgi:hypothetical protein
MNAPTAGDRANDDGPAASVPPERWCARCEWLGTSSVDACPRCRVPTFAVSALRAPSLSRSVRVPSVGASAGISARYVTQPTRGDRAVAGVPAAGVPAAETTSEPVQEGHRPTGAANLRRMAGAALPIAILVAVLASILSGATSSILRRGSAAPQAGGHRGGDELSPVPSRVFYLLAGTRGGLVAEGPNGRPVAPGVRATALSISADGSRVAITDHRGGLVLVPAGMRVPGPVRDAAFAPNGRLLAVCAGNAKPRLDLIGPRGDVIWTGDAAPACRPSWSPGGAFLSYLAPGDRPADPAVTSVLALSWDVTIHVAGAGPVAWGAARGTDLLTVVAPGCTAVDTVDLADGRRTTLAAIPGMSGIRTRWGSSCPVSAMAWSEGGRWLALAIRGDDANPDHVEVIDARTTGAFRLSGADGLVARSLAWSPTGSALIVDGVEPGGAEVTLIADPVGAAVAELVPASSASWSPDGSWVLAKAASGWIAFVALDPRITAQSAVPRAAVWARWCCPPVASTVALTPPAWVPVGAG